MLDWTRIGGDLTQRLALVDFWEWLWVRRRRVVRSAWGCVCERERVILMHGLQGVQC